jgi:V8-like Glu-specific endopeptidase
MRLRPGRSALAVAAILVAFVIGYLVSPLGGSSAQTAVTAQFGQTSTVGALFTITGSGKLENHFCTASVVDSPSGDLLVTAAHCMHGRTASQIAFVPDYADGRHPFGVWRVTRILLDQDWTSTNDANDDFAFLVVHQHGKVPLQRLTGGEAIGTGVPAGRTVEVAGYPNDLNQLISCQNTALAFNPTQYQFDCGGFTDGTSGSPLLANVAPLSGIDTVIGVIGGYEQGGDTASVSYAARFGESLSALYRQALAEAGHPPTSSPAPSGAPASQAGAVPGSAGDR